MDNPTSAVIRNTLFSEETLDLILSLPREEEAYPPILEAVVKFQDIRKFASEIHTEIHLVKPILKMLGHAYESKPKFFEDQVKGPDVALFASEEERVEKAKIWGSEAYYEGALGILILKRYGRNLYEGITGFYLEFENRIPLYQALYLLKRGKTPWAILTNGRNWILVRRPFQSERRLLEIDLEACLADNGDALHLFFNIFSRRGLYHTLPDLLEGERKKLVGVLNYDKIFVRKSLQDLKRTSEAYAFLSPICRQYFPQTPLPHTAAYIRQRGVEKTFPEQEPRIINDFNVSDVCSYLLVRRGIPKTLDLEEPVLRTKDGRRSKEELLAMKILDMTPGFGTATVHLMETLAYGAFTLPYREKNTFVAEWEEYGALNRYLAEKVLYGIERSPLALDMLSRALEGRFRARAGNYRLGNPLLGMSLNDVIPAGEVQSQMGLFAKSPRDLVAEYRAMYRTYFSLSEKIREDMQARTELEGRLRVLTSRIRDVLDLMTATYFSKSLEKRKVHDLLTNLDVDEQSWETLRRKEWFKAAKAVAERNCFFHLEIEFPFLLNDVFDLVVACPTLTYLWEEDPPLLEATKAYIQRGMAYLKPAGTMILIYEAGTEEVAEALKHSRKYALQVRGNALILTRKNQA